VRLPQLNKTCMQPKIRGQFGRRVLSGDGVIAC